MKENAYHEMSLTEDLHWWFVGRRQRAFSVLKDLDLARISLSSPAEILEVGCGTGGNLNLLDTFGTVTGVEPNGIALGYCQEKHEGKGFLLLQATAEQVAEVLPDKSFDLICMFDVLEHIDSPVVALKVLRGSLRRESSCLILSVPAFQFLWCGHDVELMHKRRYSKKRLLRELEDAGFEVESTSGFNLILLPLLVFLRLLHKTRVLTNDPGTKMPGSSVNRLLTKLLEVETRVSRHFRLPTGVSIFLVARKGS